MAEDETCDRSGREIVAMEGHAHLAHLRLRRTVLRSKKQQKSLSVYSIKLATSICGIEQCCEV